ncbi:MAG TPA: tetratricopeptide repeat protein [Burkholderiaceae bacterium]|nr:tetratricopeptide repeat protein [Burkholderiaceae bacterium]
MTTTTRWNQKLALREGMARQLPSGHLSRLFACMVALALVSPSISAQVAATPPIATARDLSADAKAAATETLYAAAATLDAFKREADDKLRGQRKQIEALQARVKTAVASRAADVAALRNELTQAQDRFVAELAERDRAYAREIAVFRRTVEDIAATPEGAEALRVYNAGEEVKALGMLRRLADARRQAREIRNNLETAADYRKEAMLALDARNKGKLTTKDLIAKFEEVTQLDPGLHRDWMELGQIYTDAGQLDKAKAAAKRAVDSAETDRDRSDAFRALGNVLAAQGDLDGARARIQDSLDIAKRLAAADPSSVGLQRDVSDSLDSLGTILIDLGDLAGARALFQESLAIDKRLATAYPSSAGLQSNVAVSLERLGDVLIAQGDLAGARARFQDSLDLRKRLAAADPSSAGLQREVSVSLNKLGDVLIAQGDLSGARTRFQDSLDITKRLAAADPSSASLQSDISVSLFKLGGVLIAQGDLAGGRVHLQDSLVIDQRLAAADPSSAIAQRDVSVILNKLGDVLIAQGDLAGARARYQDSLDIAKRLAAADPSSASLQRDVSVGLDRLGGVLIAQGDLASARTHLQDSLEIAKRLAATDPSSARMQRDVWVSMWRLRRLPESGITWAHIAKAMEEMQNSGTLFPNDQRFLDEARRQAGTEASGKQQ